MRAFNLKLDIRILSVLIVAAFVPISGCKEDVIENTIYDNVIYELDTVPVYTSNAEKNKQKNSDQYVSILYADLFNKTVSSSGLLELSELSLAVGDKQMLNQMVISGFMNNPSVILPTNTQMRNDIDKFIDDTYIRFYLRLPSEYERYYLKDLIENDPGLTPELIYTSFSLSNEYFFY